jgi:hypothetical protein
MRDKIRGTQTSNIRCWTPKILTEKRDAWRNLWSTNSQVLSKNWKEKRKVSHAYMQENVTLLGPSYRIKTYNVSTYITFHGSYGVFIFHGADRKELNKKLVGRAGGLWLLVFCELCSFSNQIKVYFNHSQDAIIIFSQTFWIMSSNTFLAHAAVAVIQWFKENFQEIWYVVGRRFAETDLYTDL